MFRRAISISTVTLLVFSLGFAGASAASNTTAVANGLKITPVRTDLTIDPGQSKTVPVYVTDPTNVPVELQVVVNNFTAANNSGAPRLIFNNAYDPHGLAKYIAPVKNVSLAADKQQEVNVVISIPKGTPGGGYYAAVRFAPVGLGSASNLTLSANIATLLLVTVPGRGLNSQLSINSFKVERGGVPGSYFFGSGGLSAEVSFKNSGNVQEQPYGKVEVISGAKTTMNTAINDPSSPGNVLPGTVRIFSVPLSGLGSFGRYKVSGYFGYGSHGQLLSASTTVFIISDWMVVVAAVILLLLISGIWYLLHWYHRKTRAVINRTD